MKLTVCLLKKIMPHRFRGKYRIVKDPTFADLLSLRHDLEREEMNMLYLRHPYLTPEQSFGHNKEKNQQKRTNFLEACQKTRNDKFSKHITIADRLNHFRVNESWD